MKDDEFYCDEDFEGFLELCGVDQEENHDDEFPEFPTDVPADGEWHFTRSAEWVKKVKEDG